MTTLNILAINCAIDDSEVLGEAISVLHWAADAGPMGLQLQRAELDEGAPVSAALHRDATRADAVLIGNCDPTADTRFSAICTDFGIYATVEHESEAQSDAVVVRAERAPSCLRHAAEQAFHGAERRQRTLTAVGGSSLERSRQWAESMADVATRFPKVVASPLGSPAKRARGADVVLIDAAAEPRVGRYYGARGWLGTRGALYSCAVPPGAGVGTRVAAAMRSAAMLLEFSATRFGLAESIRHAIDEVQPQSPWASAGEMGQAVFDTLGKRFRPCVGW